MAFENPLKKTMLAAVVAAGVHVPAEAASDAALNACVQESWYSDFYAPYVEPKICKHKDTETWHAPFACPATLDRNGILSRQDQDKFLRQALSYFLNKHPRLTLKKAPLESWRSQYAPHGAGREERELKPVITCVDRVS